MPVQPQPSALEEQIRRALARLVSGGPEAVWMPGVQPLLELPAVRERVEAGQEETGDALRAVLLEAIEQLGQSQYRNLLEIVLGLTPDSAELSAGDRRALAGERFRGGERPVTAGTIRQHHERRALTELAARLIRQGAGEGHRQAQGWTEWHPAVREAWAEQRLNLWRISISDYYNADEVLATLRALMLKHQIGAWAAYEVFGVFDLLLEAWLPANVRGPDFERALQEVFRDRLVRCDSFAVDEVVTHWAWRGKEDLEMRRPSPSVLAEPPSSRKLARLGAGDERLLAGYMKRNVAAHVIAERGIGILIAVTGLWGHPLLSVAERELVKDVILQTVTQQGGSLLRQPVLLRGSGFADYVLQGTIRPEDFDRLNTRLVLPLGEALRASGMRTHTFILGGGGPLVREEGLKWKPVSEDQPSAADLLEEAESPTLEVRSSAFADLLPDDQIGAAWADSNAGVGLMKTVTAMLNSEGGTIVLGACPRARAEGDARFTGRRLRGARVMGDYLVIGIDEEIAGKPEAYLRRVDRMCHELIDPDPRAYLDLRLEQAGERTLLIVAIPESSNDWFYFVGDPKNPVFIVRNNAGISERLGGREADMYKRRFSRF